MDPLAPGLCDAGVGSRADNTNPCSGWPFSTCLRGAPSPGEALGPCSTASLSPPEEGGDSSTSHGALTTCPVPRGHLHASRLLRTKVDTPILWLKKLRLRKVNNWPKVITNTASTRPARPGGAAGSAPRAYSDFRDP